MTRLQRALLVLATAVVVSACVALGVWQWDAGQAVHAVQRDYTGVTPQQVTSVLTPHAPFPADGSGRYVSARGQYDAPRQFLVVRRQLDGSAGSWVVTPLVLEGTDTRLPVLRGFVPDGATAPSPPSGSVTVVGSLAPGEPPSGRRGLPAGQRASVDLAGLVNEWPGTLLNGFVFAMQEQPTASVPAPSTTGLRRVPPPATQERDLDLRNLGYALQWWVFGAFAVYMVWRMLRDQHSTPGPDAAAEAGMADPGAAPAPVTTSRGETVR